MVLPFRGLDDKIGSKNNGNYLGIFELLLKFDPFLSQHINLYANKGKGHTSYLSKTISNEFITLIAKKTRLVIVNEIKKAGYYSISVTTRQLLKIFHFKKQERCQ